MSSINVEITSGENIDESIRKDYEAYQKRLENLKPKKLKRDVDMDIVARIVQSKLGAGNGRAGGKKKRDKMDFLRLIAQVLSVLLVVAMLMMAFKQHQDNKKREANDRQKYLEHLQNLAKTKDVKPEDAFKFEDAKNYQNVRYYGKKKDLRNSILHINRLKDIIVKKDAKGLKHLSTPQKNFLLAGPPGTGKTLFVKKLAGQLNMKLKKLEIFKKIPRAKWRKMTIEKQAEILKNTPSRVRIIFLTPSFINDKYIGESEKRVKELFRLASLKTEFLITLIFFDEMDAFFAKRDAGGNETHVKAQTELLAHIGGVFDDVERLVFIFGATNRIKMLDDAFFRRFANKIVFTKPTLEEIVEMVTSATSEWNKKGGDNVIMDICKEMKRKGYVQNIIMELISDVFIRTDDKSDRFKALREAVHNYNPSNDANVDINTTLFDYPPDDDDDSREI